MTNKIPDYPKEIRDQFTFHYWIVQVINLGKCESTEQEDSPFVKHGKNTYFIKFYRRNEFLNRYEKVGLGWIHKENFRSFDTDLTREIRIRILEYRETWNDKSDHPFLGMPNDCREITVAELRHDDPNIGLFWGLAIYKPDDHVLVDTGKTKKVFGLVEGTYKRVTVEVPVLKKIRLNYKKDNGQAFAIKDFERKYGKVELLCSKEVCPFGCFMTNKEIEEIANKIGCERPQYFRERVHFPIRPNTPQAKTHKVCMFQLGKFCMYRERDGVPM